ncbi:ABC transporter ATP-binding protein [Paenibacillus sp. HN-1]|uniref:ABC transporter ATP-binding protein n=1 Tax=Paenibacillus TaxID=44249 RepID=UPI001CA953A1|nr:MULTISPECIES: ABC transporter ATP-binding protein [Paenibacillus]MBY9077475.1 ABC transporter ATP-binding protein [Paenibacillus sp. CGMCC 1.18879]MBY9084748.1 ABC transporter ATP-binding protein [Paenibacillus sinensis]
MIELHEVSKRFQDRQAVAGVTLNIHKGSIFGLLGSNGAGKTTLLKTAAGIYRPDAGSVLMDGKPVYENPDIKRRVWFMPDYPYFFPQATIQQMALFYESVYEGWNGNRFRELGELFPLDVKRKLNRMSKGMRQQAAFWLALSCMPDMLIMDEPLDGLDPVMRRLVKNVLFQEVADRGLTAVISSHNLRELEDLCDHVGIMHNGELLIEKELDELKTDTHKVQVAFRDERHESAIGSRLTILHQEKRGSVCLYIVKGERKKTEQAFAAYQPFVLDLLPLTLEEIFIYEMEGAGYDISPILL